MLFSGGQDSATCLAWSLRRHAYVETIGFHYGQRHAVEMTCREPIRAALACSHLGPDHVIQNLTTTIAGLGATALTSEATISMTEEGLPNTFVPGRNLLFLTCAAALAFRRGLRHIVAGMCETDYSGYPDCRDDTVKAMQLALVLGMNRRLSRTPLMWRSRAQPPGNWLGGWGVRLWWRRSASKPTVATLAIVRGCMNSGMAAAHAQRAGCARMGGGVGGWVYRKEFSMKWLWLLLGFWSASARAARADQSECTSRRESGCLCAADPRSASADAKINFCRISRKAPERPAACRVGQKAVLLP